MLYVGVYMDPNSLDVTISTHTSMKKLEVIFSYRNNVRVERVKVKKGFNYKNSNKNVMRAQSYNGVYLAPNSVGGLNGSY